MSIIKCSECGEEFSKGNACPNCGCPVEEMDFIEIPKKKEELIKCIDCGHEFSKEKSACPNCGCPVEEKKEVPKKKEELIKCIDCGNEFSKDRNTCPYCGGPVGDIKKEEKPKTIKKEEVLPKEENLLVKCMECGQKFNKVLGTCPKCGCPLESNKKSSNSMNQSIISMIVNGLFLLFLFIIKTVVTRKSGLFTTMQAIDWVLRTKLNFNGNITSVFSLLIVIYLFACFIFSFYKSTKLISKFGYIIMLIVELLFLFEFDDYGWTPTYSYLLFVLFTVCYIIYLFLFTKEETVARDDNEVEVLDQESNLEGIKKLKELYDMNAITKEEYNELKTKMLDKEKEKYSLKKD